MGDVLTRSINLHVEVTVGEMQGRRDIVPIRAQGGSIDPVRIQASQLVALRHDELHSDAQGPGGETLGQKYALLPLVVDRPYGHRSLSIHALPIPGSKISYQIFRGSGR